MKISTGFVITLLSILMTGCVTTSSRLPLPPPLEYINGDPANERFDASSIFVARLAAHEGERPSLDISLY